MAKSFPAELADVYDGTGNKMGRGDVRECNVLSSRATFDTSAIGTTTADTLSLGKIKKGDVLKAFEIDASTNMSAASIAIGTVADPDKYLAVTALPNAATARELVRNSVAGYDQGATEGEELIVTISGATIPNGDLTFYTELTRN